jgi:hypothetical protein
MPEQLADHVERYTATGGERGIGMSEIVKANIIKPGVPTCECPSPR